MVKLKGPGMANRAAGGLGKVLTFSESKGRAYAKKWAKPANPKSPAQIAMRAVTQYISLHWFNIPETDRATWTTLAEQDNVPPMTACIGYNVARMRRGKYPATVWPGAEQNLPQTWLGWTQTIQNRSILHAFAYVSRTTGRGWVVHRTPDVPVVRDWDNFVKVVRCTLVTGTSWWTDQLKPGTYYYLARRLSDDGLSMTPIARGPFVIN